LLKTFWTLPVGSIGAGVWSTAATDGKSIWITDGNAHVTTGGYAYAIIKLKAQNLRFLTDWVAPVDGDLDWGSSPTLFQATVNSVKTQMIGANEKNGIFYAFDANHLENGPVWTYAVGATEDFDVGADLAAPAWDAASKRLYVAGNQTTIQSQVFAGSVRAFNPADGTIIWETGLTGGPVMGSPSLDGAGVLAVGTFNEIDVTQNAVYLLNSSNGNIVTTIPEPDGVVFAQPVFAGNDLFVATAGDFVSQGTLTAFTPSALKRPRH
jgi:polyvinyl alcohol dehydrogenase (cytochrome)